MMRFFFLFQFLISFLFLKNSCAQYTTIGVFAGAVSFDGDVNKGDILGNTQLAAGLNLRYNFNPHFTAKIDFHRGTLQANDNQSSQLDLKQRNFNFSSIWTEISLQGELNILPLAPDRKNQVFAPYLLVGVGMFWFDPTTNYQGKVVHLQPIGTEGQGIEGYSAPYKLTQISIPLGVGIKYALSPRINIGIEWAYRFTFTDYIDDVSGTYLSTKVLQANGELAVALSNRTEEFTGLPANERVGTRRGNSNNNDGYWIWGVHLSVNLYKNQVFRGKKRNFKITKWF